jgi:hypothetical protein
LPDEKELSSEAKPKPKPPVTPKPEPFVYPKVGTEKVLEKGNKSGGREVRGLDGLTGM